jgi:hypothetical protein
LPCCVESWTRWLWSSAGTRIRIEIVEMPAEAAGGRESAVSLEGFVVAGPGVVDSFMLGTVAHEVGHQWWADCVFAVGPNAVLLTEAMAQYAALRATEALHGAAAADEHRWRGYPGESLLAGRRGYLAIARAGLDTPLTAPPQTSLLPSTKGMLVHDLFARTIGRDRFRGFLVQFVRAHAFEDVTWDTFVADATAAFGDAATTFIDESYGRTAVPSLAEASVGRLEEIPMVAPLGRALALVRSGGGDFVSAARETLAPHPDAAPERQFILDALLADDALNRGDQVAARMHLRATLDAASPVREFLPFVHVQLATIAATAGDREAMRRAARAAIAADAALVAPTGWSLAARELLASRPR